MKHGGITRREFMEGAILYGGGVYGVLRCVKQIPWFLTDAAEAAEDAKINAEERAKLIEETAELAKFYELEYYG